MDIVIRARRLQYPYYNCWSLVFTTASGFDFQCYCLLLFASRLVFEKYQPLALCVCWPNVATNRLSSHNVFFDWDWFVEYNAYAHILTVTVVRSKRVKMTLFILCCIYFGYIFKTCVFLLQNLRIFPMKEHCRLV